VYLKSLTLRGFKSFASSTTLQLEPGITCVVGPNGSGKSNVVDALAWVMGEQGPKSLRGGTMEDVIFAGTAARPPLGRAEVLLTIDNTDGALPIEYTEVTISRTMFRNGGSEYAINGHGCRLLDIQDLLSDSGIGREMHVVVGQGQLDAILYASPEERRGFVEEAAGVLKHRKRKEKAVRKLDATDGNLNRLQDLLTEIRRRLKPLGRQADVARRAATIQADARDARARLLADDLLTLRTALERELAEESQLRERRAALVTALAQARSDKAGLQDALRGDAPRLARAQETWYQLSSMRERLTGMAGLSAERARNLAEGLEEVRTGPDPDELEAQAGRVRAAQTGISADVERHRSALGRAIEDRRRAEAAAAEEDRRVAALLRAGADRREGLARLSGQVAALRSRAAAADSEIGRLSEARQLALARASRAQHDFTSLEVRIAGLDAGERGLDAEYEAAQSVLDDLEDRLVKTRDELHQAERERAGLHARKDALEVGLTRSDGPAALVATAGDLPGLLGSVAALLSVQNGYEAPVAAALGAAADAVAVAQTDAAVEAIARLRTEDRGRAGILVAGRLRERPEEEAWPELPPGAVYAVDVVDGPPQLRAALRQLMSKVAVVGGLDDAQALVSARADVVAVTRDGDLLGRHFAMGGSSAMPSLIEVQAAVDEATRRLDASTHACERLRFDLSRLTEERESAQRNVDVWLAKLHESDAAMTAVAEELGQLGALARAAGGEADRLLEAISEAEEVHGRDLAGLADLERRLAAATDDSDEEPETAELERLAQAARVGRQAETEARLVLRTAEERANALSGQADALLRSAQAERQARAAAMARRHRLVRERQAAVAVGRGISLILDRLQGSLRDAAARRAGVEQDMYERDERLSDQRALVRGLETELGELTETVHRDDVSRAELRMTIQQLEQRALDELGLDVDALVAEYGPAQPVPAAGSHDPEGGAEVESVAYVREEQQRRLQTAERQLAVLGTVNPLALEEFSAQEERHRFLTEQLEDLKRTRRDLLDIVREVDERVHQVFTEAYLDVAREFAEIFARLFPGGDGRLVLTDPDDMLATGLDVEARPPGKRIKRLSLLSGGERSLVAVAFLVALFKARPSPFYILDEVEAALDDTNLDRLLQIYQELRESSQLMVITHQKRTMEIADALYGVSMRGDGVSAVISQRLREAVESA
jgi:chromosome segregation protein